MQFLLVAYDHTDEGAQERRMTARPAHIAMLDELRDSGNMHMGAAILDSDEKMVGSAIVCEFSSRADLDTWLSKEPFVVQNVWDQILVQPCKVGPSFTKQQ